MRAPRVTSELWVFGYKKVLERHAVPIFIVRKGNREAGAIIVKISDLQGMSKIFVQSYSGNGDRHWIELAAGKDSEMDKMVQRQTEIDSDLWVLEVETRSGTHYLDAVAI